MKPITRDELYAAYLKSLELVSQNPLEFTCANTDRAVSAAKISSALAGLYSKIVNKDEDHISNGKAARCVAKHIAHSTDQDLFDSVFAHTQYRPSYEDHKA